MQQCITLAGWPREKWQVVWSRALAGRLLNFMFQRVKRASVCP